MDGYKKKLKSWYDKSAERYDSWGDREGEYSTSTQSIEEKSFNLLLDRIKLDSDAKVLDIAVGTGIYLIEVLKRFGVGYGIDISDKMIEQLKLKVEKIGFSDKVKELVVGDADKLPFEQDFFDFVSCIGMFEYYDLGEVVTFLKDIKRVIKKSGWLIVDFPNSENDEVYEFQKKERSVGHEVHIFSKKELLEFLEGEGFEIVDTKTAGIEIQFLLRLKV